MKRYVLIIIGDRELNIIGTYKTIEDANNKMTDEFMKIFEKSAYYDDIYDDDSLNFDNDFDDSNGNYGYFKGSNAYINEVYHVDYDLYIEEIEV